ncbi:macrophage mannose receptor 1 [Biomphalaria glabrata]|uniref:Macrophage mannose receptor 1-like n=1 Tax=Biomphalaria glabrata TaxID=6526 RepID=A0A2C9KV55_BIOGL|nr:macrophage mannose receptor 1-like [Biomphalaria glabrata]KAI8744517.1 macrophage mannose receptor 1 [Biomphalaria glabrata]KAI8747459.1 macrophage mannose receptor 1-like [Biomphalaria glabrata]
MRNCLKSFILKLCICLVTCQTINDCPSGVPRDSHLRVFGDSCYQFVLSYERTHSESQQYCERHGGTLALVKSQDVQNFLYHTLTTDYRDFYDKLWIGLNDIIHEGHYFWEDGTPLIYSDWGNGEGPSSGNFWGSNHEENDCVVIDLELNGKWSEYPCEESTYLFFFAEDELHSFICQYKALPTSTTLGSTTVVTFRDSTTASSVSTDSGSTESTTVNTTPVTGLTDTTVLIMSNSCPAFSCDLDCGMDGFQKNETSGCSLCQCAV